MGAKNLVTLSKDFRKKFSGAPLTIELVPRTCWFSNVRDHVRPSEWDKLRKESYEKANNCCEICGGRGKQHAVECHEIWIYDDNRFAQTLKGLISLCPKCHDVKHYGRAELQGRGDVVKAHLTKVNGWTNDQTNLHIELASQIWIERSKHEWHLNFDWLTSKGIAVKPKR